MQEIHLEGYYRGTGKKDESESSVHGVEGKKL